MYLFPSFNPLPSFFVRPTVFFAYQDEQHLIIVSHVLFFSSSCFSTILALSLNGRRKVLSFFILFYWAFLSARKKKPFGIKTLPFLFDVFESLSVKEDNSTSQQEAFSQFLRLLSNKQVCYHLYLFFGFCVENYMFLVLLLVLFLDD